MITLAAIEAALDKLPLEKLERLEVWLQAKEQANPLYRTADTEEEKHTVGEDTDVPVEESRRRPQRWVSVMAQIVRLSPAERTQVAEFIRELESSGGDRVVDSRTFEESARRVFERHAELMKKLSQ